MFNGFILPWRPVAIHPYTNDANPHRSVDWLTFSLESSQLQVYPTFG